MDVKRQQSGQNWTHSASWSSPRSDCTQHCTNTVLSFQPTSCPSFSNRVWDYSTSVVSPDF